MRPCNAAIIAAVFSVFVVELAQAATFDDNDFVTYDDSDWGSTVSDTGGLLFLHFSTVYASTAGELEIGMPGPVGKSIILTGYAPTLSLLPDLGNQGVLACDLVGPNATSSGSFGSAAEATNMLLRQEFRNQVG